MERMIIFGKNHYQYNGFDINRYIYHDAIIRSDVMYVEPKESVWNRYLSFFYSNEYGTAIRQKLFIPFKNVAFHGLLRHANKIRREDTNIFVFFYAEPWFFDKNGFLSYLRRKYRHAKLVYHITNIIQNIRYGAEYYLQFFDLVSTCNRGDSEKYGIPFYANACSYLPFEDNGEASSELLFVGQAKNRLDELVAIFEILAQKGVSCEFFVNGVKEQDMRYPERIHYNHELDYDLVLKKIEKTNVILELLQKGMDTHTLRYPEAVNYGKKLLTNNAGVVKEKSYSPDNIRIIGQARDVALIDRSFFASPAVAEYPDRDSVSTRSFPDFLKEKLGL